MTIENQILAALPTDVLERLRPHLERVTLAQGTIIHRPGEPLTEIFFPIDCLVSITITMADGATAEVGMAGTRDVLGLNAVLGKRESTQTTYIVQAPGEAIRIGLQPLRQELERHGALYDQLLLAAQAFLAQVSQTAACNALHTLEQRLPRWLLETQTRVHANYLPLTQEFIAQMLGVRRSGVTQAAQRLQERQLIQYQRGKVQILDQAGLEASACECFKTVQAAYDHLLGKA